MTANSVRWPLAVILLLVCSAASFGQATQPAARNVRDFGAAGDGTTKDTAAFQKALDETAAAGGGTLDVPAGNYLIGSIVLGAGTTLHLDAGAMLTGSPDPDDYPITTVRFEGRWVQGHRGLIFAQKANGIAITGLGTIAGDMRIGDLRSPRAPVIFEPVQCDGVRLEDFSVRYRRMWSIHLTECRDVTCRNLNIRTTLSNGDGIDVDSCRDVRIEHCDIDTGDDCVALKSGRGMEGVRAAEPTQDVAITDCTFGSDFAGVAIGSEMSGGILNVLIQHCTITRGANSLYLKSRTDRGGFIINVSADDLTTKSNAFMTIALLTVGIQDPDPVQGNQGLALVSGISVTHAKVDCRVLLEGSKISPDKPVDGLTFADITGTCQQRGITLANVAHADLHDIQVTGLPGPLLNLIGVTGTLPAQAGAPAVGG